MVYACCFTVGYLIYDCYYQLYWVLDPDHMTTQYIFHHVLSISTFVVSLLSGHYFVGVAASSLVCEISSVFLLFKLMASDQKSNSPLAILNQVMFFLSFSIIRMYFFPKLMFTIIPATIAVWDTLPLWR